MNTRTQLDEEMQTTCLFCSSLFRITQAQLDRAQGKVRCGICGEIFNALLTLENYQGQPVTPLDDSKPETSRVPKENLNESTAEGRAQHPEPQPPEKAAVDTPPSRANEPVSLQSAMYGEQADRRRNSQWLWGLGIIALIGLLVVQVVYYLRYDLISRPEYQQQVLNLCRLLPCDENRFISPQQVRLIERNVFTHPTRPRALMISGRLVNRAPFPQKPPRLRISLSDIQGNLIANRLFTPDEYLTAPDIERLHPGRPVPFRLEIHDPDEKALTYEFDFVS